MSSEALNILTVVINVALLAVTVVIGRGSIATARQQRKAALRPVVIFRQGTGQAPKVCLVNIGAGVALNVNAWFIGQTRPPGTCWDRPVECRERRIAEAIWVAESDFLEGWRLAVSPSTVWIRYQDAEGTNYHSHYSSDGERYGEWRTGDGNGPAFPAGEWELGPRVPLLVG